MYSSEAIFALVSSTFNLRVLSELNSESSQRFWSPSVMLRPCSAAVLVVVVIEFVEIEVRLSAGTR